MVKKTVAQTVVDTLIEIGVKYVFGVPSGAWVDYMEAMRTTDGIEFVLTTHEGGAGFTFGMVGAVYGRSSCQALRTFAVNAAIICDMAHNT